MISLTEFLTTNQAPPVQNHYIGVGLQMIRLTDSSNWILAQTGLNQLCLVNRDTGGNWGNPVTVQFMDKVSKAEMVAILKSESNLDAFHAILSSGRPKISEFYPQPKPVGSMGTGTILVNKITTVRYLIAYVGGKVYMVNIKTGMAATNNEVAVKNLTQLTPDEVKLLIQSINSVAKLDDWQVETVGFWAEIADRIGRVDAEKAAKSSIPLSLPHHLGPDARSTITDPGIYMDGSA